MSSTVNEKEIKYDANQTFQKASTRDSSEVPRGQQEGAPDWPNLGQSEHHITVVMGNTVKTVIPGCDEEWGIYTASKYLSTKYIRITKEKSLIL